MKCAERYEFNGDEAMNLLKFVTEKKVKVKAVKGSFPLPFNGEINEMLCQGVKYNEGLFTQCQGVQGEDGYCVGCSRQAVANGEPDCGNISRRAREGMEFKDSKGRKVRAYAKIMKKYNLTEEQVLEEAGRQGVRMNPIHLEMEVEKKKEKVVKEHRGRPKKEKVEKVEKGNRGRPKKEAKEVELDETEDLFATLMSQAQSAGPIASVEEVDEESLKSEISGSTSSTKSSKSKKGKLTMEEEGEMKGMKESEKESKAAEKEIQNAIKKGEKKANEESKAAERAAKKALEAEEKAAKKLAEEEERAAKKALEAEEKAAKKLAEEEKKAAKKLAEEEKAAKKALEAETKAAKKLAEEEKKAKKDKTTTSNKVEEVVSDLEEEEESEDDEPKKEVTVKKFEHEGKQYLISSENVIYDAETQDCVGTWDEKTKSIVENDEDSESDEEEE